jgi:hypothetical protein
MGYCLPTCNLCVEINDEIDRRINKVIIIKPKRPRGRPRKYPLPLPMAPVHVRILYWSPPQVIRINVVRIRIEVFSEINL